MLLLIGGCTVTSPKDDNLLSTLYALNTGEYTARIQAQTEKLAALKQEYGMQKKELSRLQADVTAKQKQLHHNHSTLQSVRKKKQQQAKHLSAAKTRQLALQQRLQELRQSISTSNQSIQEQQSQARAQREKLYTLTRKRDQLRQQLEQLLNQD